MPSAGTFQRDSHPVRVWGFLVLSVLWIALDRWWKGSTVTTLVHYVFLAWVPIWFAFRIRAGYLYRKPYWTRASWLRFLRLAAMPVGALVVLFTLLYFFDSSRSTFGSPQSAMRVVWAIGFLGLMGFGAIYLPIMIDWMVKGDASEQFTRTRLFRRRGSSPIAD